MAGIIDRCSGDLTGDDEKQSGNDHADSRQDDDENHIDVFRTIHVRNSISDNHESQHKCYPPHKSNDSGNDTGDTVIGKLYLLFFLGRHLCPNGCIGLYFLSSVQNADVVGGFLLGCSFWLFFRTFHCSASVIIIWVIIVFEPLNSLKIFFIFYSKSILR